MNSVLAAEMASTSKQQDASNNSIITQKNNLSTPKTTSVNNAANPKSSTSNTSTSMELITKIKQESTSPPIPVIDVEEEINDLFKDQFHSINIYRKRKSDSDDIKIVKKFKSKSNWSQDDEDDTDVMFFKSIRPEVAALNFDNKQRFKYYVCTKIHELLTAQRKEYQRQMNVKR